MLAEVGYDRLTMDAVATRAKASKATLYRRWTNKASLVIDALMPHKGDPPVPDTGILRGDLHGRLLRAWAASTTPTPSRPSPACSPPSAATPSSPRRSARDVIGPKIARLPSDLGARPERGEVRADIDLVLLEPALAGIVLHRVFVHRRAARRPT